jgi:hypothetical protein
VASAYRDTEAKVKAALKTPAPAVVPHASGWKRFFGVYMDARAYTSLFYLLLTLVTGVAYFTFVVVGVSLSAGFAILIIGVPFFLAFIGIARVIALGEGRLLEAVTGERMPRRPLHPGPPAGWLTRIGEMLKDMHTWTTLLYLLAMLPLGIIYFTVAVTWVALGLSLALAPLGVLGHDLGWLPPWFSPGVQIDDWHYTPEGFIGAFVCFVLGVLLLTALMHFARWIARGHARLAKALLVEPGA